jgi:hypothetical protein
VYVDLSLTLFEAHSTFLMISQLCHDHRAMGRGGGREGTSIIYLRMTLQINWIQCCI